MKNLLFAFVLISILSFSKSIYAQDSDNIDSLKSDFNEFYDSVNKIICCKAGCTNDDIGKPPPNARSCNYSPVSRTSKCGDCSFSSGDVGIFTTDINTFIDTTLDIAGNITFFNQKISDLLIRKNKEYNDLNDIQTGLIINLIENKTEGNLTIFKFNEEKIKRIRKDLNDLNELQLKITNLSIVLLLLYK